MPTHEFHQPDAIPGAAGFVMRHLDNSSGLVDGGGEAEALYREVLAMDRKMFGDEHPDVAVDIFNLASLLKDRGDYDEAILVVTGTTRFTRELANYSIEIK